MSGLRDGIARSETWREEAARARPHDLPCTEHTTGRHYATDPATVTGLAELHEAIAELLASRGRWQQAYHHLRAALDLRNSELAPPVPEQLRHEVNWLRREHARAREQSLRDTLTGGYNRRYLDERLTNLLSETTGGLGIALVDLDWFKQVNDTFGHVLGDRVLQRVAELLQEELPTGGFCARYGGEEFVLVLPDTTATGAVSLCERTRLRIANFPWRRVAHGLRISVSIGLTYDPRDERPDASTSTEQKILGADVLLYAAKQAGRNVVAYREGGEVRLTGITRESESSQQGY
ncbi:diguanylate cyclase (GGDEF) domain-containing protein [Actinopolyspora xinjiangensis]|uniref:Diguanylate cyclase (GGDEF) domain-containing protein n=1 Tax=Actinopolyspora xinjiangensis TaxID=405564 RepID=A0A1H0VNI6_9ACTN|nr:GGDEF domain-containing protein [Actinopolyspora xinjiangensis]SDP79656.1 diguanylate cyclase (GGDEF) domain-containing protein [Actinopolyspora xinjiangensis]